MGKKAISYLLLLLSALAANASAQDCPSGSEQTVSGSVPAGGSSQRYSVNLQPCETVTFTITLTATSGCCAAVHFGVYNSSGGELINGRWAVSPSGTFTKPALEDLCVDYGPGNPYPGTRGSAGLPAYFIVESLFLSFDYTITMRKAPRPSYYNTGGTGFASALSVASGMRYYGSLHTLEDGQFYKIRLNPGQLFYLSGTAKANIACGTAFRANLFDARQQFVQDMLTTGYVAFNVRGTRSFPPEGSDPVTYTNTTGAPQDMYLRLSSWSQMLQDFNFKVEIGTIRAITVSLTQTPLSFIPRNHVAEGSLTCDGCYQDYTATINPPSVMGKIRFELYAVSAFRGDATNHCFNTSCTDPLDTAPDYYFNLSAQPPGVFDPPTSMDQIIQTTSEVNSATVRVSSRDYGGVAKIRAIALINDVEVTAAVEGTQDLFARIPLDNNQNGIADSWEAPYGGNLDPNRDDEDGPTGSQSPGDGYTALEEYRGFFVLDSGTPRHLRTDPVNRKDVFFWNPDAILSTSILFPETPFFQYHEIAANSANPRTADPADGVNRHNFNSTSTQQTFALVYVNRPLGGNCATVGTVILGDAGSQVNDGSAIRMDGAQIAACATRFVFPGAVLQAQVSAHETGHKYGLSHPVRNAPYVDVAPPALPTDQYTRQVGLNRFYVWYEDYPYLSLRIKAENAIYGVLDLVNNTAADILGETIFFRPVGSDSAIFQIDLRNPLDTTANRILVNIQQRRIMDWTPRFTLQMMTDWHYDPAEPPRMCVRSSCP